MSKRVAFKAALATLLFLCLLSVISSAMISGDRNDEICEELAFATEVFANRLGEIQTDRERMDALREIPAFADMRVAYYAQDGSVLYSNASGDTGIIPEDFDRAVCGEVIVYEGKDGSVAKALCAIYQFEDGAYLRVSRASVPALLTIWERPISHLLLILGSCVIVFLAVLAVEGRRHSAVTQIMEVLENFSEGDYDARVNPQKGDPQEVVEEAKAINALLERLQERTFRQRTRDHALNVVMNQMQNGILVVDAELKILLATPVARKLLGIPPHSEGTPVSEASKDVSLEPVFNEAMRQIGVYTNEVAARTAVGRGHRPLRLYVSTMRQDGQVVGALAMVEDITELRRLEQVRTDFVANVSHELKTPLTSIKGFVETLQNGAINNPEMAEKFLKIIMLEAERLTRLINDILSISKLESGMTDVPTERIRLDKMAFEIADMLRIHAGEKKVTINAHMNKDPVYIIGNPDRVEQMLINLIENGIKYNKPGGSVTVHVFGNDREANFTISDTGIGIAEEHLPRMFERFYRVDKGRSRSMGGTGLGLAIVKHIVRSMNGEIEVHSKLGEGTEFLVTLPIAPPQKDDEETPEEN